MNSDEKSILDRIKHLEDSILKAEEYLRDGSNSNYHGFQPLFRDKVKNGKVMPPHRDWVRNVFLPNCRRKVRKSLENLKRIRERCSRLGKKTAN
jgi:hypothetical protein